MKLGDWISLLCLIAAGYILWQIKPLLLLSFAAVVIAIALNSLTQKVKTTLKISRRAAIPITLAVVAVVALIFILGIVPPFVEQFRLLAQLLVRFSQTLPDRILDLQSNMPERIRLPEFNEFIDWLTAPDSAAIDVFGNFFSIFNSSLQILLQTLFVSVLSLMILANPEAYLRVVLLIFPAFYRQRAKEIFDQCELILGHWLAGIFISSVFVFIISFIGLLILKIDLAFAHALLAGILNFIPNLGPTLSMVFPVVVALISNDPWKVVAVVGLYIIIQQIESYWLTPTIMAHQVSLLPAFTLIAQIFFASVFGFLGLLLALPLTVVVKTWIHEVLIIDLLNNWQLAPSVLKPRTPPVAAPSPQPNPLRNPLENSPN
ncbi:MAG: AI-2E family transporter [Phormidesmis sp.]